MFFFLILVEFVAFPSRKNAILYQNDKKLVNVQSSGSIGIYKDGKCVKTHPNQTLNDDEMQDWCSNIATNKEDNPWIQYSLKEKQMRISGFSIRNGCCRYAYCCEEEDGQITDKYCCCFLYSYSLLASNDNKTWTTIHKVEKDKSFYNCEIRTFDFDKATPSYTYFRLVLDEEWPGCLRCMQVNQLELYGEVVASSYLSPPDGEEDESVSIIGRINREE